MTGAIGVAPLVPWPILAVLGALALALVVFAAIKRARGTLFRALALAILGLALLNPRLVDETRAAQPDVAVIVVDESASQRIGEREARTRAALDKLEDDLARLGDIEVRVVRSGEDETAAEDGTRLFATLERALVDIPRRRFAGAALITDGQVHDVPAAGTALPPGPVHVLLSGDKTEHDRRLVIDQAPSYGIVGKSATIAFHVEDEAGAEARGGQQRRARVELRRDGVTAETALVPVGRGERFTFTIDRAGPSVIEVEVEEAPGELSATNNRAAVSINGVRDRLRVLLVSGQPHPGERTWRNLLKSDPAVDLVHFTILRPPEKDDFTPLRELALIVFPVRELFEVKLSEFDLIVFDRYVVRDVLPPSYLRNIEEYVRAGGALLLAVGPEFAGIHSLFRTPLGPVMPAVPTGQVFEAPFRPAVADVGRRHPVTASLAASAEPPRWGRWFRHVEAKPRSGVVLMKGENESPLLVVDRVDKGRVAQLMSDHIWLWARNFEGGGPQAELLRRLAHWLMKEPDLEEERLGARVAGGRLLIERQSLGETVGDVTVTAPSGATRALALEPAAGGRFQATVEAGETGLYRVSDGTLTALAAAGSLNPREMADLRSTPERLAPVAEASGGGLAWIADGLPDARRTRPDRDSAGRGWLGFVKNDAYVVTGVTQVPLLPALLVMALAIGLLGAAWWREGR